MLLWPSLSLLRYLTVQSVKILSPRTSQFLARWRNMLRSYEVTIVLGEGNLACVAAQLPHGRKWVCVITNKSVFCALHGCPILYNRFWLLYGFLHSNEIRDWLAYPCQSSPFSVSMFWFCTWIWQINLAGSCAYSLLGNGSNRIQSFNSTFCQKYRPCR